MVGWKRKASVCARVSCGRRKGNGRCGKVVLLFSDGGLRAPSDVLSKETCWTGEGSPSLGKSRLGLGPPVLLCSGQMKPTVCALARDAQPRLFPSEMGVPL